ncbi:outer membrane lipoprotein [Xylophilus sp. ASV27]|uniref:glycine zipper 2TM domain-containing protein n=1 Tax=Xylophilus sp. ASV27 TaxID=2795129 RepID=UPI0018ED490F|nr:glycine zipper 2TM domain-containing protein [Xylophilus sp. ASV27]
MSTSTSLTPVHGHDAGASPLKPLWIAIGVLAAAVLALGGTLVYQNTRPAGPATQVAALAPAEVPAPASSAAKEEIARDQPAPPAAAPAAPPAAPAAARAPVVTAPRPVPAPAPAYGSAGAAYPEPVQATPVCGICGRVESVQPVQRAAPPTGVGAVAGGVLGGVLGNQIGHGSGRAAATVLGAVGGGFLGNTVEKRTNTQTAYLIHVRMEDGSRRTFERSQPVPVGEPITLEGRGFRLGQSRTYSSDPYYRQAVQPQGTYATGSY